MMVVSFLFNWKVPCQLLTPTGCYTDVLPMPGSRGVVFLDTEPFPLAVGSSCVVEGLGWSFPFLMTMRTSLYCCAWCRSFRTSPWAKPASVAPLTDRRKSPRLIVPSWEAAPWENTLWTWDKERTKPNSFMMSSKNRRVNCKSTVKESSKGKFSKSYKHLVYQNHIQYEGWTSKRQSQHMNTFLLNFLLVCALCLTLWGDKIHRWIGPGLVRGGGLPDDPKGHWGDTIEEMVLEKEGSS